MLRLIVHANDSSRESPVWEYVPEITLEESIGSEPFAKLFDALESLPDGSSITVEMPGCNWKLEFENA